MKIVSHGAKLKCSMGDTPSNLAVLPVNMANVSKVPMATVQDYQPMVNIMPFGLCKAPTNPAVIAMTAAKLGVFTPAPCIPKIETPWVPPDPRTSINGLPVLNDACTCLCKWAGVVAVDHPATEVGLSSGGGGGGGSGAALGGLPGSSKNEVEVPETVERPDGHHIIHQFVSEITGEPLAGVHWRVRSREGILVAEGVTGNDGFAVADVPSKGKYLLEHETEPPLGLVDSDDFEGQHHS